MPIAPRTICSLGATPPSRPRRVAGTNWGAASRAPAFNPVLRKDRRLKEASRLNMLDLQVERRQFSGQRVHVLPARFELDQTTGGLCVNVGALSNTFLDA